MKLRYVLILAVVAIALFSASWSQHVKARTPQANAEQGVQPTDGKVFLPYVSSLSTSNQPENQPENQPGPGTTTLPTDPPQDSNAENSEPVAEIPADEESIPDEEQVVEGQYVILWKTPEQPSNDSAQVTAAQLNPINVDRAEQMMSASSLQTGGMQIDVIDVASMTRAGYLSSAEEMLDNYRNDPMVEAVEPNYVYKTLEIPNDSGISRQWAWDVTSAYDAWDITEGSEQTIIAVIDTGVDLDHPDLDSKLTAGYDFVGDDDQADDANGHGTHVAGIVAAETNNGAGGAGFCPNCKIMPLRALNRYGSGSLANIASAITYATDNGAKVINLSLGGRSQSTILQRAINYAWDNGVFITCAAGNSGVSTREYPAGYSKCVAVAASTDRDVRASFSNYGEWVELAAPGQIIYSTYMDGQYANSSGTSMAAPHVAGLAGLLSSQGLSNNQIRQKLCNSAEPIAGTGTEWSCGRLNAASAVANNGSQPQPTATSTSVAIQPLPTALPPTAVPPEATPSSPVATPTPAPTTQPAIDTYIRNGGFENGVDSWTISNGGIISTEAKYSGVYSARLGGENNSTDAIEQTAVVPDNGVLTYRWGAVGDYDTNDTLMVEIELLDGSGAKFIITNNGWNGYWYTRSIRVGSIAGKAVRIRFSASTNGRDPRTFYLDDVSLQ